MARTLRPEAIYPITTRRLTVLRVADVTPAMRRVTIGGQELAAHTATNGHPVAAFRSDGFDDEFKIVLPDATGGFTAPTQADGTLNWPSGAFSDTRTYTVRRWDPVAGEIDVDVVKHGSGRATTWAYSCAPGEPIHVAGPKMSYGHPNVEWLLIAGDETALPAIARWLEELAPGVRAQVFVEVGSRDHIQTLATEGDAVVTWLSRDGAAAGTTSLLFDALRGAPWQSDDVFAWAAGEALTLAPIRRWLRNDKQLPRERVEVTGYWRRAASEPEDAAPGDAPEEAGDDRLHELLEIVPPVALRVAVTLGLFRHLSSGPLPATEIAAMARADAAAVERLLRYLAELDVVESSESGRWRSTALGAELDDDYYTDMLDLRTADGRAALGIVGLLEAIVSGRSGHVAHFGRSFGEVVDADAALSASRLHSTLAEWGTSPLSESPMLSAVRDLRIAGPGAGTIAVGLSRAQPELGIRLLLPPSQVDAAERLDWPASERIEFETGGLLDRRSEASEAFLLVGVLAELPDPDVSHVLAQAAASTLDGSVLVFEDVFVPHLAGEHEYERDLEMLAVHGGALRTGHEVDALAEAAGLRLQAREIVGWGHSLRRYARA